MIGKGQRVWVPQLKHNTQHGTRCWHLLPLDAQGAVSGAWRMNADEGWAQTAKPLPDLAKTCAYSQAAVAVMRHVVIRRITDSVMTCQQPVRCVR